jgi:hypothetical protein
MKSARYMAVLEGLIETDTADPPCVLTTIDDCAVVIGRPKQPIVTVNLPVPGSETIVQLRLTFNEAENLAWSLLEAVAARSGEYLGEKY